MIKLVLDRKVSWSKNLGTFLGKYSWTDSLNLLILLPLCCFISSLLDLWMAVEMEEWANMKLWRTLKILWLSLATPYHTIQATPPNHTLLPSHCEVHNTMQQTSYYALSKLHHHIIQNNLHYATKKTHHEIPCHLYTSPYNVMHATEDIKVQCMFLDTLLCVYLEFDFSPVLMVRNLYLTKPKYISNKIFMSS